ncbi:MAG: hypothetical protein WKF84_13120 [Pyrinomonadaceae bacterium]
MPRQAPTNGEYFDAISDDGRDALVIIFLAGFLFSPNYNRAVSAHLKGRSTIVPNASGFPAIAISQYRDGRPIHRVVAEYNPASFTAARNRPACRIGRNQFELRTDEQGNQSYIISLVQPLRRGCMLEAELAWKIIDGDLLSGNGESLEAINLHDWNLVAPRCEVTGTISVLKKGGDRSTQRFAGVGYHDHNRDRRWMPQTVDAWQWGRAHFPSMTAVFYRFKEKHSSITASKIFTVQDSSLRAQHAGVTETSRRRHIFGLNYPAEMRFETPDKRTVLFIRQKKVIDGSFFYLRFLSEATLEIEGARQGTASAVTEHLAPGTLAWPALWWLINMRIGKGDGRPSFLP